MGAGLIPRGTQRPLPTPHCVEPRLAGGAHGPGNDMETKMQRRRMQADEEGA